MNKIFLLIIGLVIVVLVAFLGARFLTGEDSWICVNGQWIKHGNPSAAMPEAGCGNNNLPVDNNTQQANTQLPAEAKIIVTSPQPNEIIHGPLAIEGKARGSWFFEGVFPIKLLDSNGKQITSGQAHVIGDWMTSDFVPFSATLDFKNPATATGTLLFQNDNPSGLPEKAEEFRLPVRFK